MRFAARFSRGAPGSPRRLSGMVTHRRGPGGIAPPAVPLNFFLRSAAKERGACQRCKTVEGGIICRAAGALTPIRAKYALSSGIICMTAQSGAAFGRSGLRGGSNMKAIEFCGVSFRYDEESPFAIHKLDFSVEEGEFVAVLGHNGSGKSTLARLSNGLLEADEGEIRVFGTQIARKNLYDVRKNVGVVFQNPDNQTVATIVEDDVAFGAENLGLAREEIGERIRFALQAVGMQQYRTAAVARLSGGQKQRVAIAGVLALKPRAVILDEATAMLDPRGRREIVEVVSRLNREEKITVIMITHFMEEALLADRAVVMNRGEIVMQGAPADIFERQEELITYNLAMPRIGYICNRLRAGGLPVANTLDSETLAEEIARCVS